jgi:proliferating cell nuclear antigen PCNA
MKFSIASKQKKDCFNSILQQVKQCTDVVQFMCHDDHIYIQGMDRSHVCLFEVKLKKSWFAIYEYQKATTFAVDSSLAHRIFTICGAEQICTLIYDDAANTDGIALEFTNLSSSTPINPASSKPSNQDFEKYFNIPLINCDNELLQINENEYDADFKMPSKKWQDLTNQLANFGENVTLLCSEENIDVCAKGENGTMKVNIPWDMVNEYSICEGETVQSMYLLTHLNKICINPRIADEVHVHIKNDNPLLIHYDLGDDSICRFYLAPKINDD